MTNKEGNWLKLASIQGLKITSAACRAQNAQTLNINTLEGRLFYGEL